METQPDKSEEMILIGCAIYIAQKVELALYGIAAHASHLPAAQREKRFKTLTPETFLRGDPAELKATLGQLVSVFGDDFLIGTPELIEFCEDRNLIVHNYFRVFHAKIRGVVNRDDPIGFLKGFVKRALEWQNILEGFLAYLREAAAKKEGRESELVITQSDRRNMVAYSRYAAKHLRSRIG